MSLLIWTLLGACAGGTKESEGSTSESNTTQDTNATDTQQQGDTKPVILGVTAENCTTNSSNPDAVEDSWLFTLSVDDPQGAETVRKGTMSAQKAGKELASLAMACSNGICVGSTRSSIDHLGCDLAGSMTMVFVVTDTDEHSSDPYEYQTK